jgi:predicted dehydrogenase
MPTTRRVFLASSAAPALAFQPPSDRIRIGVIGAGGRGRYLMQEVARSGENAAVVAVCDVWRVAREQASEYCRKTFNTTPKLTSRYQELLAMSDVDAVLIATPDSTHSKILADSIAAGKDAYCEKPMGTSLEDARAAYLAVKASSRVVQIGTQRRSEAGLIGAAKMIRDGVIGKITRVDLQVHFQEPRWRRDYTQINPDDIDWEAFAFGRNIPKDMRVWREWQLFFDTTNGIPGLWMSHFIDIVSWFLDDPYPRSAVSLGGVYLWKDGRQTSDVFHSLLEYPKDCLVSFAMSLTNSHGSRNLWFGTLGTFDGDALKFLPEGSRDPKRLLSAVDVPKVEVESHMANFLRCVRSRQTPRAPVQAGFSHAVAGIMSATALAQGRRVGFDPVKLELT